MTGQYIITEEQLKAIEKWDTRHLGNEYRSRPLSSALKAERERVLGDLKDIVMDGLWDLPQFIIPEVRQGKVDTCEWVVEKIESLRSEP